MGWKDRAVCSGMDTNLFIDGDERAIAICRYCSVSRECYDYAIQNDVTGVWGGTTDKEREGVRHRSSLLGGEVKVSWGTLPVATPPRLLGLKTLLLGGEIEIEWGVLPPQEPRESLPPLTEIQ